MQKREVKKTDDSFGVTLANDSLMRNKARLSGFGWTRLLCLMRA